MRVILADDSVLFREGLARVLEEDGFDVVGQVSAPEELFEVAGTASADVAIVDIRMPPTHTLEGLEAAVTIRSRWPALAVLVLSGYIETQHVMRLISGGGRGVGYLLKDRVSDLSNFRAAVRSVGSGGSVVDPEVITRLVGKNQGRDSLSELTDRERVVLAMMAQGRSNLAVSERLGMSLKTVETHVHSIFGKLELEPAQDDHRRVLAVLTYLRQMSMGETQMVPPMGPDGLRGPRQFPQGNPPRRRVRFGSRLE
jgi:DNA-binding NarL/FixJ family response regulator